MSDNENYTSSELIIGGFDEKYIDKTVLLTSHPTFLDSNEEMSSTNLTSAKPTRPNNALWRTLALSSDTRWSVYVNS
jgi:hypothetical protein